MVFLSTMFWMIKCGQKKYLIHEKVTNFKLQENFKIQENCNNKSFPQFYLKFFLTSLGRLKYFSINTSFMWPLWTLYVTSYFRKMSFTWSLWDVLILFRMEEDKKYPPLGKNCFDQKYSQVLAWSRRYYVTFFLILTSSVVWGYQKLDIDNNSGFY